MRKNTTRTWAAVAGIASLALVVSACGGEDTPGTGATSGSKAPGEKVKLVVSTFNDFGYKPHIEQFMKDNPDIIVEEKITGGSDESRENMFNFLGQKSGLADVEAIEGDWVPELMQYADKFVDLTDPALANRWLDWKIAGGTDANGRVIMYGTDSGPNAVAYRADLFEKAGLPSDRESVAKLLTGDWANYFEVGKQYTEKTGKPWFDTARGTFFGMINQVERAYENTDGTVRDLAGSDVETLFRQVLTASAEQNQSSHTPQWKPDWDKVFKGDNGFATILAPGWMLNVIKERGGDDFKGWDIADVFPGGAGNWGGSFLAVPTQSKHPEEAKKLAAYLTSPEVQSKLFVDQGAFPSTVDALKSDDVQNATFAWFNDAPTGKILSNRAVGIKPVFKGPLYKKVSDVVNNGLDRVDLGVSGKKQSIDESWAQVLSELKNLN
ncbi:ABC transporter substrate-binding protein [Sanguibacter sp. HDW7]|uniref:ABC transporter substrate-binding protein n=1 Tax=Sanguibacter sp. HDW7 TaxID=2714931 RepID=UPI001F105039|nr:ABC transporter substrate-binding protein [Sanguibacter sp. HDW7]